MQVRIKSCLAVAVFMLFCCGLSQAQTISPEKKALIKEFFEVMGGRESSKQIVDVMTQSMEKEIAKMMSSILENNPGLTPAEKKELQKQMEEHTSRANARYRELFTQKIDVGQLIEDISYPLYDKHFTENELKDLITFYKSPTGQKIISVTPALIMDSMAKTSEALLPVIEKFIKETSEAEAAKLINEKKQTKTKPKKTQ